MLTALVSTHMLLLCCSSLFSGCWFLVYADTHRIWAFPCVHQFESRLLHQRHNWFRTRNLQMYRLPASLVMAASWLRARICFVLLQDKGMMNFPKEQYNVPEIKASASTFDDLVASLRSEARGGWWALQIWLHVLTFDSYLTASSCTKHLQRHRVLARFLEPNLAIVVYSAQAEILEPIACVLKAC